MSTSTYLTFELKMLEPGGVTTPAELRSGKADAVVDTDHHGNAHVPAASLAGALRARIADRFGEARASAWFGAVNGNASTVSPIWVLGTQIASDGPAPQTETRASTAVNRPRGAARNRTLRQVERLPAGTRFRAYLRWDTVDSAQIEDFVAALGDWEPVLGRGVSAGNGRCRITDLKVGRLDTGTSKGRRLWLTLSGPDLVHAVATEPLNVKAATARTSAIRIPLRTVGPLAVGGRGADQGCGPLPMFRTVGADGQRLPTIPASSVKGVVRSRIEYILRSVDARACPDQRCGEPACLPCQIFGHGGGRRPKDGSVGQRGAVRIFDSPLATCTLRLRTHAPLDRFTGGSARRSRTDARVHAATDHGGLLHTTEGVEDAQFTLHFDVAALAPDSSLAADFRALLRLAVADVHDGYLGIGHAVNRGYGSLRLDTEDAGDDLLAGAGLPRLDEARARLRDIIARCPAPSGQDELVDEEASL